MESPKILFILKRREDYDAAKHSALGMSTGLFNSANFVNEMLNAHTIESKMVVVTDNNDIDREVSAFRPTHVVIEALWVVPTKFTVLQRLHPNVTWIIRLHSEMPFMAGEGMAMDWLGDYSGFDNIVIGVNAPRMREEVKFYLQMRNKWTNEEASQRVVYLPNYYPKIHQPCKVIDQTKDTVDIGCFGAVRPLKNHLVQAHAALMFAEKAKKKLRFHVNAGRIEMKGEPMLNNLKGLFEQLHGTGHELINHPWCPHEEFIKICASMDIGMQVTFSETFNIVAADLVSQGVPTVGSSEIPWSHDWFHADPADSAHIATQLMQAYNHPWANVKLNQWGINLYSDNTVKIWTKYLIK